MSAPSFDVVFGRGGAAALTRPEFQRAWVRVTCEWCLSTSRLGEELHHRDDCAIHSLRVGCAACDRGDFQLGHHHQCPVITGRGLPTAKEKGAAES